jgi:uncharacterized protein (TIGR02594 family)
MPTFDQLSGEYATLWDGAQIVPANQQAIAAAVQTLVGHKPDYDQIEAALGVPWYVVGLIHYRESSFSMTRQLHNGDPLSARTVHVPAGRPLQGNPPFTWVESAIDALQMMGFQTVKNWTVERIAYQLESYNGWGYRKHNVNSPYLWSFTNQYSGGLFVADHVFDPNGRNSQAGGLALLKQLVADGTVTVTRQSGVVPPQPKPPVPVPTGLFEADGAAFKLAATPAENATLGFRVTTEMPIKKLTEVDATWWQIEATAPDGVKHAGFTKAAFLKPQTVDSNVDEVVFAETCLSEARVQGTSAHFLIALADAESGLQNKLCDGAGGRFGPFALTDTDWTTYNDPTKTGYGDTDRFKSIAQVAVAAAMVVKLTTELQAKLADQSLPTSEELYLARIVGSKGVPALLAATGGGATAAADATAGTAAASGTAAATTAATAAATATAAGATLRSVLVAPDYTPAEVDAIFAARPSLLTADIKVQDLRTAIQAKLDAGFVKAVADITAVEPDVVVGPSEASAPDASSVPWMDKAKSQIGVTAAGNPAQVTQYLAATTLGPQPATTPWCAAFVSWCIKQAGGSPKVHTFSARAADWLDNGDSLAGPQFGAVGVTKPLVAGDSGHVGFVTSFDGAHITMLGGNQSHSVCEKAFPIRDFRGFRMM